MRNWPTTTTCMTAIWMTLLPAFVERKNVAAACTQKKNWRGDGDWPGGRSLPAKQSSGRGKRPRQSAEVRYLGRTNRLPILNRQLDPRPGLHSERLPPKPERYRCGQHHAAAAFVRVFPPPASRTRGEWLPQFRPDHS